MVGIIKAAGDMDAPFNGCKSCGEDLKPTLRNQAMCHRCSESWHDRRRLAEREVGRLRHGIRDIAARLDSWTDHNGDSPSDALLALARGTR